MRRLQRIMKKIAGREINYRMRKPLDEKINSGKLGAVPFSELSLVLKPLSKMRRLQRIMKEIQRREINYRIKRNHRVEKISSGKLGAVPFSELSLGFK